MPMNGRIAKDMPSISSQTQTSDRETPCVPLRAICHPIGNGQYRMRLIRPGHPALNGNGAPTAGDRGRGPFPLAWRQLYAADYDPLPLPARQKQTPPSSYTGHNGKRATIAQLAEWESLPKYENGNICDWFGSEIFRDGVWYQLIGIDVDQYHDKHGGDQLKELEKKLGPLSKTWISGARIDGVSGIRWFLAPLYDEDGNRIRFHDRADTDIDIIQRHHRYALVWPSLHPDGGTYWWFPPGVVPNESGKAAWSIDAGLPALHDLPVLPREWVAFLTNAGNHEDIEIDWSLSVSELEQWADDEFNPGLVADACWNIVSAVKTWKRKIDTDASSHDKIRDSYWMIGKLASEGHTGWKDARDEIGTYWHTDVLRRGKRGDSEAQAEIFGAWISALRKIKTLVDAGGVSDECDCFEGDSAKLWHSENVPMGCAKQLALLAERDEKPLRRWRGDFYRYSAGCYEMLEDDDYYQILYDALENAQRWGKDAGGPIPWNPEQSKLRKVTHALQSLHEVLLPSGNDAPFWLDPRDDLDSGDQVIAFQNTLLRISDRKQIDHTTLYFNSFLLPFDYDPVEGEPTLWLKFLSQIWPDDPESIALLQEWFGYVISGRIDMEKLLVFFGLRRTGKGTIAHVLRCLLGRHNCCGPSADSLGQNFGKEPLIGKTLAIIDEMAITGSGKKFVSVVKDIVGRGAPTIDRKHKTAWNGNLGVRFMLLANQRENLPDASGAIIERSLVLETTISFEAKPDRKLRDKLEEELPAILNWALDGLDRLDKQGHFTMPESTRGLIDEMYAASSPITEFFGDEDVFKFKPDGFISRATAFNMWCSWCEKRKLESGSMNLFLAKIRAAYGRRINADINAKRLIDGKQDRALLGVELTQRATRAQRRAWATGRTVEEAMRDGDHA
jgi:P4 family phage/plasmid primase-like protien